MGPRFVRRAALFYGVLVVAAALWNGLRGRNFTIGDSLPVGLLLGLLTAAGTVLVGLAVYRLVPVMRKMAEELAPELVDRMGVTDLVLISIFSGVGEEMFFPGCGTAGIRYHGRGPGLRSGPHRAGPPVPHLDRLGDTGGLSLRISLQLQWRVDRPNGRPQPA